MQVVLWHRIFDPIFKSEMCLRIPYYVWGRYLGIYWFLFQTFRKLLKYLKNANWLFVWYKMHFLQFKYFVPNVYSSLRINMFVMLNPQ